MTSTTLPARHNGVDTATLFATLDAVRAQPALAKFQFRATHRVGVGTHNTTTIHGFHVPVASRPTSARSRSRPTTRPSWSARTTRRHPRSTCCKPWILPDERPGEHRRGAWHRPRRVTAHVEGDIDLLGILGLDDSVRNGFSGVTVTFEVAVT